MRTATKILILKILETVKSSTILEMCEEQVFVKMSPRTIQRAFRDLHKAEKIHISRWEREQPGKENYPRPVFVLGKGEDAPTPKYVPKRGTYNEGKMRAPLNETQRIALNHNWSIRTLKGIKTNLKHMLSNYGMGDPEGLDNLFGELEERIIIRRKDEIDRARQRNSTPTERLVNTGGITRPTKQEGLD